MNLLKFTKLAEFAAANGLGLCEEHDPHVVVFDESDTPDCPEHVDEHD